MNIQRIFMKYVNNHLNMHITSYPPPRCDSCHKPQVCWRHRKYNRDVTTRTCEPLHIVWQMAWSYYRMWFSPTIVNERKCPMFPCHCHDSTHPFARSLKVWKSITNFLNKQREHILIQSSSSYFKFCVDIFCLGYLGPQRPFKCFLVMIAHFHCFGRGHDNHKSNRTPKAKHHPSI